MFGSGRRQCSSVAGVSVRRWPASDFIEPFRDFREDLPGRPDVGCASSAKRLGDHLLDGSGRSSCISHGSPFEPEARPPAVTRIAFTREESARHEALQNPGDRAGMQPDDMRELARRQAGKPSDDAQHESLRSSDSQLVFHPLGHPLEAVFYGPEKAEEVQNRTEGVRGNSACITFRHGARSYRDEDSGQKTPRSCPPTARQAPLQRAVGCRP